MLSNGPGDPGAMVNETKCGKRINRNIYSWFGDMYCTQAIRAVSRYINL